MILTPSCPSQREAAESHPETSHFSFKKALFQRNLARDSCGESQRRKKRAKIKKQPTNSEEKKIKVLLAAAASITLENLR
mmetsp:Transcript_3557/g.6645  ORF Transcript_3557/g.6645 Transcript_3557/m.6645 type:complete len:80 (+) Transcript_3557:1153-1392(+)